MRWSQYQVVCPLRADKRLLRSLALGSIAFILLFPTLADSVSLAPPWGGDVSPLDTPVGAGWDTSTPNPRFWSDGGIHDVVVVFRAPNVVQWRLALEAQGIPPAALADAARAYKLQLESAHQTFLSTVREAVPDVAVAQEYITVLNGLALRARAPALDLIAAHPDVDRVEPDTEVTVALADSVPLVNADDMWSRINGSGSNITGKGVVVAVLDTGIDYSHPDLGGTSNRTSDLANVTSGTHPRILGGWNLIANTSDFWDGHFHGTHCAGIVGANGTVVGVAPDASFRIYKVLSDSGSGPTSIVIAGVEMATDPDDDGDTSDHADVISMSLGGFGHPNDAKSQAVDSSVDAGVVVSVSAANRGPDYESIDSPGCARKVISVGATSKSDYLASFSSVGPTIIYQIKPDLTAPGVAIYSTSRNNGYTYAQGTSMACPHVSGSAALLLQSHPDWTPYHVKRALMGTAIDVGYNEYRQGAGRINVTAADDTPVLADPPSLSLGRLSAKTNTTGFTVTFENLAPGWTNGTLRWSLAWALTPLYTSSGSTADLSSMLRANTTSLDIPGGGSLTVRFTLAYDETASVGHHLGELTLTTSTGTIRVPLAFYIRAPILLVDDDNTDRSTKAPYNNHNPYYSYSYPFFKQLDSSKLVGNALTSLGVSFDVMAVRTWYDGPTASDLSQYRAVIWNCAFDYGSYGDTLTANDAAAIRSYSDGGGNVWLMGSLVLYDLYGAVNLTSLPVSDVVRGVFGVGAFNRHSGTPDPLPGTAGTFLAGVSYDVDTVSFGDVDYGANLTPVDGAYQLMAGDATDDWGAAWSNVTSAIARDGGNNKTLFTSFEFGHIASASDREDLVDLVLEWIDLRPHGALSVTGTLREGETVTLTGQVLDWRATERYVFEWDLDYQAPSFTKDATGPTVTNVWPDDGRYLVALRVLEQRTGTVSPVVEGAVDIINQAPEAHINTSSPGEEGSPVSLWGNATDPGGNDTFSWEWDFDYDGVTFDTDATSQNATHTYLDNGTYTVALRVTDDEGLPSAINTSQVVVVNLPPSGSVFTPGTSNEGDVVPFTASVQDPSPLDTVTVRWDFEYNGRNFREMANGTSVNHVFRDNGAYTVIMRLTDEDGGVANITLQVLVRNVAPEVEVITSAPASEGDVVDFNSTVTDPGELDYHTFEWDFEYDGIWFTTDSTYQNASWQYVQDGNYTAALSVTDDDGGSTLVYIPVNISNLAPQAIIEGPKTANEGDTVQFVGRGRDPGKQDTFTFSWDFGDGGTSRVREPTYTFLDDGTFNVTLTVTDNAGASGSTTLVVQVANVNPNATVSATPRALLENQTVYFQADGFDASPLDEANLTFTWNFGDGETSNLREVRHLYLDDGDFTVTLTVQDDDGGVSVYTLEVTVNNVAPMVFAEADREYIKEGESVNFTAVIQDPGPLDVHTIAWDFDDGTTSDQLEVSHEFRDDGNYIVILTVTDDSGGTNTTTFRVAVSNVRPVVTASANRTDIKEGEGVSFSVDWTDVGELDEHTVLWTFGDGNSSTERFPVYTYVQDGTFTVLVTVTDDDGGQASKPFIIEVDNVAPTPSIEVSTRQIDETGTVVFSASATDPGVLDLITFYWDLGDGTLSNEQTLEHTYNDNGVFKVTLRAADEDEGISSPVLVTITVNNVPPRLIAANADLHEVTVGKGVTFSASATDISPKDTINYTWNFGDLQTSDLAQVVHIYTDQGTYNVTLIVSDDDNGQTPWQVTIVVLPDMDGDGIPDSKDKDRDGDGYDNSEDDWPNDPERWKDWTATYLALLLAVVIVIVVVAYLLRPKG